MLWWLWIVYAILGTLLIWWCNRQAFLRKYQIPTLSLQVLPVWFCLHMTMGERFGTSYVWWLLLGWLIVGGGLSFYLMTKGWSWRTFWIKYWQWTGLVGYVYLLIVVIIGFSLH